MMKENMRFVLIFSLYMLMIGVSFASLEVVNTTSSDNLVTTAPQKTHNKIKIYDLKCVDQDLQRTLTWKVKGVSDNLHLIEYVPRFSPMTAGGNRYKLRCYKDKARTVKLQRVTKTICKSNVSQFLPFSYNHFSVRAKYQDFVANKTVTSAKQKISCDPVDMTSHFTAPGLRVTKANKTAMTVAMSLPMLLTQIDENLRSSFSVEYHFCVYESGGNCSISSNKTEHKFGVIPSQEYSGLSPDVTYQLLGWYIVHSNNADISSEQHVIVAKIKPEIYDLRCVDLNFQRTLTWKVEGISENLRLIEYIPKYRPMTADDRYKLRCYKDDARTEKLQKVNETICKSNVTQFLPFSFNYFTVQGKFHDVVKNETVAVVTPKTRAIQCEPVDIDSKLNAPSVSVTKANKTALVVSMTLPSLLADTEEHLKSTFSVKYHFCVYKSGYNCSMSKNKTEHKFGATPSQDYTGLSPGETYQVRGWYYVDSPDATIKSETTVIVGNTMPDPFPNWAKILTVGLSCGFLIMVMSCTFLLKKIYGEWNYIDIESKKKYAVELTQALDEFRSYVNPSANPTADVLSNWWRLQRKENEIFEIPQLTDVTCTNSSRSEGPELAVACGLSEQAESCNNEETRPTSSNTPTIRQHAQDEISIDTSRSDTVILEADTSSGSDEHVESAQENHHGQEASDYVIVAAGDTSSSGSEQSVESAQEDHPLLNNDEQEASN